MSLIVSDTGGGDFELAPAGTTVARCYQLVDLGTQVTIYKGDQKLQRKVIISWELPNELMEDGRPFSVNNRYTMSLSENAHLRKDLESWRNRPFTPEELAAFNITTILGAPCMLGVVHNKGAGENANNTYANPQGIMALMKGQKCPPAVNEAAAFDIDAPDMEMFESFGEKLKATIRKAPEWHEDRGAPSQDPDYIPDPDYSTDEEPIPF